MSLQTPTIIRVLQRKLCREAKKESTPHRCRLRSVICFVCLMTKPVGEPDAGNPHVRFDERGWETERRRMAQATAPILDSTSRAAAKAQFTSAFGGAAEVHGRTASAASEAYDPKLPIGRQICCAAQRTP